MSKILLPAALALAVLAVDVQAGSTYGTGFYMGAGVGLLNIKTGYDEDEIESDFTDGDINYDYSFRKSITLNSGNIQLGYQINNQFSIEGQFASSMQSKPALSTTMTQDLTAPLKAALTENGTYTSNQIADIKSVTMKTKVWVDASLESTSIFAVYKTSGIYYAKVKGGATSSNLKGKQKWNFALVKDIAPTTDSRIIDGLKTTESIVREQIAESLAGEDTTFSERETRFAFGVGAGYRVNQQVALELEAVKLHSDVIQVGLSANYYF